MQRSSTVVVAVVIVIAFWGMSLTAGPARAAPPGDTTAQAEGVYWLSYHQSRDIQQRLRYVGGQSDEATDQAPDGLDMPEGLGEEVRYSVWKTPMDATGFRHVALANNGSGDLCNQLVIDSNGDGRLDDESIVEPYHLQPYGRGRGWAYFEPVALTFDSADGPILYHLNVRIYCRGPGQYYVQTYAGGWYQGLVSIGGKATECQLIDYNANGTFNDTCGEDGHYGSADRVRFTTDAGTEPVFAGAFVRHEDRFYAFSAAQDGAYVTINEASGIAIGTLAPPDDFQMVRVYGPQGSFIVEPGQNTDVPAGTYRLESWQREVKPASGLAWRFTGRGFPQDATVEVSQDARVELALGEPWVGKLNDRASNRRHSIDQLLVGRYGERIDALYTNGRRPPAPRLQIVSADGNYDRTFKFEYG